MQKILATCALVTLCATAAFAASAKAGQAIYDKSCKSCHGADGTPNAAVAKMMKADMKDLKSSEVQAALSDDDMKKVITEGKGKMKPVKSVSGPAIEDVIAYVRSLKK
jgi:mono/diheme cytochrome c family protein